MRDNSYFAICPQCGKIDWYELNEDIMDWSGSKVNYLKPDGNIAYINEYVRLKKKGYIDIVCVADECPMVLIPFDVCPIEERKKIYYMSEAERIKYASRFEILDALDEEEQNDES
jgi:hypothetical protein